MTYSSASPITGTGVATGAQIDLWFARRGPEFKSYAPDKTYRPAPAIGDSIVTAAGLVGVNSDLVAAQCLHESAAWQSAISRDFNNPAGLGSENDDAYGKSIHFATPADGIRAQVAHLADYARGKGDWTAADPRASAMPASSFGRATSLKGLDGFWAVPGVGYGAGIAVLANDLLAFVKQTGGAMPFELPASIAGIPVTKNFIPTKNSNRPGTPATASGQQWITVHETANPTVGANAKMHNQFVVNGGGATPDYEGVSFTLVVDDHSIYWNLPLEEKSWQASDGANGDGNSSVSIETCINADGDWNHTKVNLALLLAFLVTNVPNKSVERITQHNHWARDHKNCPTRLRANDGAEWNKLLGQVRGLAVGGVIIPSDNYRLFPETGHGIGGGFLTYWTANGGLPIFGYPLTEELQEDGRTVQYFERSIFEYHPENQPPFDVLLRRLGAEALERKEAA